jgi:alkylated DNA nucleotide flippase Atl1
MGSGLIQVKGAAEGNGNDHWTAMPANRDAARAQGTPLAHIRGESLEETEARLSWRLVARSIGGHCGRQRRFQERVSVMREEGVQEREESKDMSILPVRWALLLVARIYKGTDLANVDKMGQPS